MRTRLVVLFALILGASSAVGAQIAVHDPAVTAKQTAIAALKEYVLRVQRDQHERLRRMAQRLSAFTNLRKYALPDPPRWRTHGDDGFMFIRGYNDALIFGDSAGAAYLEAVHPVLTAAERIEHRPAAARRAMLARLATIELTDAAVMAATHDTGQLRFNGRKQELPAIDALEADVIDPRDDHSATAVLDKISGATLIGARQRQARMQLLSAVLEQLVVDTKRARDTDTASLNMQLTTWRDRRAANEALVSGSADALRTWRQP